MNAVMIRKSDVVDCYLLIVDVEINWNAQDLLVSSIGKKDLGVGGRAQYEVSTIFWGLQMASKSQYVLVCLSG